AKLSYSFLLTERTIVETKAGTDTTTKETQGQLISLTVFHEFEFGPMWSLGVALSWNTINSNKDKNDVNTPLGQESQDSGHTGLNLQVYAPINVADNITLIPRVTYGDNGMLLENQGSVK